LHVKITTTGSIFHYGKLIAALEPWPCFQDLWVNQLTQLPYIVIDPNTATGGILDIPFYYPYNAIQINKADIDNNTYARVHFRTINDLQVMGDTTTPVYIQVYTWMTDVSLYMPTYARMDSELTKSVVELGNTLGSAAAKAPVIGKYARATMIAAKAAKEIGSELGFSRPNKPVVETRMLPQQMSNLSNFNIFDFTAKLALDAQQETFVDGESIGLTSSDDMSFSNIITRESLLVTADWTSTSPLNLPLARMAVTPSVTIPVASDEFMFLPCSQVASCFQSWRGSMIYRIEIVATPFHRGKLKITYDPLHEYREGDGLADYNVAFSHIIDMSETRNYEFCVGWGVNKPYMVCGPIDREYYTVDPTVTLGDSSGRFFNGIITIAPVSELTAGVVTGGSDFGKVYVNIYVAAHEDMEFGGPTNERFRLGEISQARFDSQVTQLADNPGGVSKPHMGDMKLCLNESPPYYDSGVLSGTHFGEKITSLRQLLKRYNYSETVAGNKSTTAFVIRRYVDRSPYIPIFPNILAEKYTNLTLLNMFLPSFLGYKGSMRWKYLVEGSAVTYTQSITRSAFTDYYRGTNDVASITDETGLITNFRTNMPDFGSGGVVTDSSFQPGIEAEIPYYSGRKFIPVRFLNMLEDPSDVLNPMYLRYQLYFLSGDSEQDRFVPIHKFCAIGDDFSLFVYKFAPVVRLPL
jgi:hypothetical protein